MAESLETFTDQNWEKDVLGSARPVLVDFWAEWCQPCKALVPTLEDVARRFAGRLRVGKMNVEENEHVPGRYNIRTLPTLLLLKGGAVVEQRTGLVSRESLLKLLEPQV
ncbi:MAG: thioredoxin [Acidobacteria bacterium]|nr:thioredoxin [Acidobacteriota bacterium]